LNAVALSEVHNEIREYVLAELEGEAPAIARRMAAAAQGEVAEYAAVRDAAFAAEVVAHAEEHVHAFVRAARRGRPPAGRELDFVAERGAQRVRELLPLDSLLETYLIGQRTVWEAIVAAAGESPEGMRVAQELTAVTFVYTHAINVAIAAAYIRESQALASQRERARRDLLDSLLSGGGDPASWARRAEALGLRPDEPHAVVVADAGDDPGAVRLATQAVGLGDPARAFVVARQGEVIAVLPVYVRRGPRELRAELDRAADRLQRTHGAELRAGVSTVCPTLADVARGYAEARRALLHAPAAGAAALEEVGLFDYLAAGADGAAERLVPPAVRRLAEEDGRQAGALSATLHAYADCDLNVARAAQRLLLHPNTVHYRLRRIAHLSGRDPRRFGDLVELLTALRLIASSVARTAEPKTIHGHSIPPPPESAGG
jgi:hypothetical protein